MEGLDVTVGWSCGADVSQGERHWHLGRITCCDHLLQTFQGFNTYEPYLQNATSSPRNFDNPKTHTPVSKHACLGGDLTLPSLRTIDTL